MEQRQYRETDYFVNEKGEVFRKGNQLKPYRQSKGYLRIDVYFGGEKKATRVHRMVAEVFLPNPEGLSEINHKDGDKTNNKVDNLEWTTGSENMKHRSHTLGINIGDNAPNTKLTTEVVKLLRWMKDTGYPMNLTEMSKKLGVNTKYLSKVVNRRARIYVQ